MKIFSTLPMVIEGSRSKISINHNVSFFSCQMMRTFYFHR